MPQLLVWRKQSATALFKKGDVISVMADSSEYSDAELANSHTTLIELSGITLAKAKQLLEKQRRPAVEGDPEYNSPDESDRWIRSGKNKWYFSSIADHFVTPEEINLALTNREGSGIFTDTEANTYG